MSADGLYGEVPSVRPAEGNRRARGSGSDVWLTPPGILAALGPFDLDPCAAPEPRPWPTAARHYTAIDDGMRQPWAGRVWLNPPYSDVNRWLARLADHGTGTALIFARVETRGFTEHVWRRATALLFLPSRLSFYRPNGKEGGMNAGAPSVLIAYGQEDADALAASGLGGAYVPLSAAVVIEARRPAPDGEAPVTLLGGATRHGRDPGHGQEDMFA